MTEQGIVSTDLMTSLGIFIISIPFMVLAVGLYYIIKTCTKKFACCGKIHNYIAGKIFYSSPIRYVIFGQLKVFNQFVPLIIFGLASNENGYLIACYFLPIVLLIVWPFFTVWFLFRNHHQLNDEAFHKKFISLYEGIHVQSFSALCYQAIYSVHRYDLVIVNMFFSKDSPLTELDQTESALKIICFILIQVVYLAYFHSVHPHD